MKHHIARVILIGTLQKLNWDGWMLPEQRKRLEALVSKQQHETAKRMDATS